MGRPTKYKPEMCQQVIGFMAKGYSKEAAAAQIGVHRDTLYEWAKVHPMFSDAIKLAEGKSLLFWEKLGIDGAMGKISHFNASSWIFTMKNRFRWRDNPDLTIPDEEEAPDDYFL